MSKLIILRGNSGSGKTTAAKALQRRFGPGTLLISLRGLPATGTRSGSGLPDTGAFLLTVTGAGGEIIYSGPYAQSPDVLTIPAGDDVHTYFYIVPKDGVTPSEPVCKVYLYYNDPTLGKVKVTYNYSSLPGYSDDSSEIWVYYVPADQYNNNLVDPDDPNSRPYLKMYYQDSNNPLVPTANQS